LRHYCYISTSFLGAFTKLRKTTTSFVMPDRLSERNDLAPTGWIFRWIFIKLVFFENLSRKFKFHQNLKNDGNFTWRTIYSFGWISLNSS
jgi:hypothetical protein